MSISQLTVENQSIFTRLAAMENSTSTQRSTLAVGLINYILIPAYILVVIIGLAGNTLVLIVIKRKRSMHSTTNFLLANLAAADFLTLLWCIPGQVMTFVLHPRGVAGDFLCKFVTMHQIAGITQLVSGLTLTVLAVERYKALFYPLSLRLRFTKNNVKYPIVTIWLFSIAFVFPLFFVQRYDEDLQNCLIAWDTISAFVYWGILTLIVIVSFSIMLFCYFNIIKGIYFTKTICSQGSAASTASMTALGKGNGEQAEKRKIVKLLLSVTVVFLVCFLPFCVTSVVMRDMRYAVIYSLSYFLVYCSSSLNPFIYAFHSSNYREAFNSILLGVNKTFHCDLAKKWRARHSNKMSSFELRATYHATNSEIQIQQPKITDEQNKGAKLLSFKIIDGDV